MAGFGESRARAEESRGRQQVADIIAHMDPLTGGTTEQMQALGQWDPELLVQLWGDRAKRLQQAASQEHWVDIPPPERAKPGEQWQQNSITGQKQRVGGGGIQIDTGQKGETKWEETVAAEQARTFTAAAQEGIKARSDLASVDQLDKMIDQIPTGSSALLTDYLKNNWGISLEGADKLQAFNAIISKLTPQQRPAGSGTMSDRDIELFKASLPSMVNSPEGNRRIIAYLRGMAQYTAQIGDLSQQVITGRLDRNKFYDEAAKLANPLADLSRPDAGGGGGLPDPNIPPNPYPDKYDDAKWRVIWDHMTPEQKQLFLKAPAK
jgi:hypothetical protein